MAARPSARKVWYSPDWVPIGQRPCGVGPYAYLNTSVQLNGALVPNIQAQPTTTEASPACAESPGCYPSQSYVCSLFNQFWFDATSSGDFPGYVHGAQNVFTFNFASTSPRGDIPRLSIEKAELTLTFTCRVCVDVDNNFIASAPVDDNKSFVPGSTLAGADVPLPVAGNPQPPIQQVKLHVLTPGVRGGNKKVKFEFLPGDVSKHEGYSGNTPAVSQTGSSAPDMDFGAGQQAILLSVPSSNDTVATMNIYDYGASGTVTVTAPTSSGTTIIYKKRIPRDNNGDGLPDAGWYLRNGSHVADDNLSGADDSDSRPQTLPQICEPAAGEIGDGLTAFEEYRGFVQNGQHIRLDPWNKDLFVRVDATLSQFTDFLSSLPLIVSYCAADELSGDGPAVANFRSMTWANGSRARISGTSDQRALRIKERLGIAHRMYQDLITGDISEIQDTATYGATYYDGDDTTVIQLADDCHVQSTDEQMYVDIFTDDIRKRGIILFTANTPADPNARICGRDPAPCDSLTLKNAAGDYYGLDPGHDGWQTACAGNDRYGNWLPSTCNGTDSQILGPVLLDDLVRNTVAHEAGHGTDIRHADCTTPSLMSPVFWPNMPYTYSPDDQTQIKVHRKH